MLLLGLRSDFAVDDDDDCLLAYDRVSTGALQTTLSVQILFLDMTLLDALAIAHCIVTEISRMLSRADVDGRRFRPPMATGVGRICFRATVPCVMFRSKNGWQPPLLCLHLEN